MDLAKFTPDQCGSLVANVVGGRALPPGLVTQIIARTDGVPLFVEELTKTILELGDLIVAGDRYVYAGRRPRSRSRKPCATRSWPVSTASRSARKSPRWVR